MIKRNFKFIIIFSIVGFLILSTLLSSLFEKTRSKTVMERPFRSRLLNLRHINLSHSHDSIPEINVTESPNTSAGKIAWTNEEIQVSLDNSYFKNWANKAISGCSGLFTGYANVMVKLQNTLLDKTYSSVNALGGAPIRDIIGQKDEAEIYKLKKGFFQVPCDSTSPSFAFTAKSGYLPLWLKSLSFVKHDHFQVELEKHQHNAFVEDKFTIAIMRIEYHNVYWSLMDLYNIFLTMNFFKKSLNETKVLLIDERPHGQLDDFFKTIYNAKQLHSYPNRTVFKNLVWMYYRDHGPILTKQPSIPLVKEFKEKALMAFKLPNNHTTNCDKLNIVFIWRRNYIPHPRKPKGEITRKIKNEDELLNATRVAFPSAVVQGIQLDNFTVVEQLAIISTTDILIGMHGAGLSYALFMPSNTGVIEMFPYGQGSNWHMEYIVKWAKLHYKSWRNTDRKLDHFKNEFTTVPPSIVQNLIKSLLTEICS